jgi:PhnB protein
MKFATNLIFQGQCREAFERYAAIFDGKITAMISFADAPDGAIPDGVRKAAGIMHAWLDVGDQSMMGCDTPPGQDQAMAGFSASFHSNDAEESRRVFTALAEGGSVTKPFGEVFWSPGFGMLIDRFGTPWVINTNPAVAG